MESLKNVIVYIDHFLIHSKTHKEHLSTLYEVLNRLINNYTKVNLSKYHFENTEVSYLGFRLTPDSIKPGNNILKAVEKAKIPDSTKEIKSFMGLCNFFRTHVMDFAPLNKATRTRKDSSYQKGPITG